MIRRLLHRLLLWLYRRGYRFDKVLYDDYRVPLVCRAMCHDPGFFLNGQAACNRCQMPVSIGECATLSA